MPHAMLPYHIVNFMLIRELWTSSGTLSKFRAYMNHMESLRTAGALQLREVICTVQVLVDF